MTTTIEPRERPILFSAEMVRATLAGLKTQTRRIVKPQPDADGLMRLSGGPWLDTDTRVYRCPFGEPGDRLWVREGFARVPVSAYRCSDGVAQVVTPSDPDEAVIYRSGFDLSHGGIAWKPSIHMPRWASRITLEVTHVRVERVQDISEEDAIAEGVDHRVEDGQDWYGCAGSWTNSARVAFAWLWNSIYGPEAWERNDWVFVGTFRRIKP